MFSLRVTAVTEFAMATFVWKILCLRGAGVKVAYIFIQATRDAVVERINVIMHFFKENSKSLWQREE